MSTSSTVAARVASSVSWISKSCGVSRMPGPGCWPRQRVGQGARQVEVERPAELVGSATVVAFTDGARRCGSRGRRRRRAAAAEQLVEDPLAQPPRATRRQLEALAAALGVARLFEQLGQLLKRAAASAADSRIEQLRDLVGIDLGQLVGRARCRPSGSAELVHPVAAGRAGRARPASVSCSPSLEVVALAQALGQQRVERRGELRQVPAQPVVVQQRVHHVLQLLALLGAHRLHQRLHLGHARRRAAR